MDGTIVRVNRTFEALTGHRREALVGASRFQDLLAPGDRIYHDTHHLPMLHLRGAVREIAVEVVRPDGSRLPALVNSVVRRDRGGAARGIRVSVFDATERRRYERGLLEAGRHERDVALELQRGLLAGDLPSAPGLEIGVAYRPGVSGLEAGGDWYDAFWLEEGAGVALVVGDVVGRGIGAAATMGQLRSAVRALAVGRPEPGALVDALEGYSRRHAVGRLATLVYADLDLAGGRLRFACAGHPPPVLVPAGRAGAPALGGTLDAAGRPAVGAAARRRRVRPARRRGGAALHRRPHRAPLAAPGRGAGPAPGRGRRPPRRAGRGPGAGPGPRHAAGGRRGRRLRPRRPPGPGSAADVGRQVLAGEGRAGGDQVGGRALEDDPAAVVAGAGAEVDDPVGVRHDGLVVLDHDHRLAGVDQAVEQAEQVLDVGQVQAGRRLVEDVDAALLGHVGRQLQPLALAAGQRGERLAEAEVAEPDVDQPVQDGVRGRRAGLALAEEPLASATDIASTSLMSLPPSR